MAPAVHSYLLPMPASPALPGPVQAALHELEADFALDADLLDKTVDQMMWEFSMGLSNYANDSNRDTFLPMIPTYIHAVPNGTETGTFLALDLGGTNLRVCSVQLLGNNRFTLEQEKYKVSEELKTGTATALFDYIATSVGQFVEKTGAAKTAEQEVEPLFLGFTFSFPVEQTALDKGTLINWTKGFKASGAAGNDVVQLLQDALNRQKIPVRCSALVNDTVGTMLSRAYQSGTASVGAIFGTGTNGAYLERMSALKKQLPEKLDFEEMILNTEWGAFDNERKVLRVTPYDEKLDQESINPRKQAFEKMVSGMYMGEVVRNVLLSLIERGLLFSGHSSEALNTHYGFDTALMSSIEEHPSSSYTSHSHSGLAHGSHKEWAKSIIETRKVLTSSLGIKDEHISDADCLVVRRASELVGTRGARLSAVAIAAVIKQVGWDKEIHAGSRGSFDVGVDGSLVEFYPGFECRVRGALRDILGVKVAKSIGIGLAKDGSGIGAALCALSAKKQVDALAQQGIQSAIHKTAEQIGKV